MLILSVTGGVCCARRCREVEKKFDFAWSDNRGEERCDTKRVKRERDDVDTVVEMKGRNRGSIVGVVVGVTFLCVS